MEKIRSNSFKLLDTSVFIENKETKRYLFCDGEPIKGERGAEGGWKATSGFESPKIVGADANYYNRALWIIHQSGDYFIIENKETKRYLFCDGEPIKGERGAEKGWKATSGFESPKIVGADANYYNRALWIIYQSGDDFIIENKETRRYLFCDGEAIKGERGAERGWKASSGFESPKIVGADANYYNRAFWKITAQSPLKSVSLEYTIKGKSESIIKKDCELLVIACEPRNLYGICDYTPKERAIFDKLRNFTFHTSLLKVEVKSSSAQTNEYAVMFAPKILEEMNGSVYAFRNESAKQFGHEVAKGMTHNLVTVYQLVGETPTPVTADFFDKILNEQLSNSDWWPFSGNYEVLHKVITPYFDHFSNEDLKKGLPWELLSLQGQNNTLYVHGFTCFESVLHCWEYAKLMLEVDSAEQALPKNLNAPIVILGAGVSGLLFAVRLKRLGYKNIEILESTDRYRGKTHTFIEDGPYPSGSNEKTVCELGTCYLSPAYYHMIDELKEFLEGNEQIDFANNQDSQDSQDNFRGIVTKGAFPNLPVPAIIPYPNYIILKAINLLGLPQDSNPELVQKRIAFDLIKYCILHWEIMGAQKPMPPKPPTALLEKTFYEFLEENKMLSLVGMMEYIYSVQGYGVMTKIPAYYGLIWITPIVIQSILFDNFSPENVPVVTAWKKGWGDLWKQIVEKEELCITYLAETRSIKRQC
jgi:hypothetical protein